MKAETRKVPIPQDKWIWNGEPQHLCVSQDCRYHLATYIGNYVVSSVGDYWLGGKRKTLGSGEDSFYETMVFRLSQMTCPCGCGKRIVDGWLELEGRRYKTAAEADKGHLELCKKYAKVY